MKKNEINLFTLVVIILPILSIYASGIPGFSFGDVCLLLVTFLLIIDCIKKKVINIKKNDPIRSLWILIFSIIFITIIDMIIVVDANVVDILIRVIRRVFYYGVAVMFTSMYFQYDKGGKLIIKIGVFASLYLILQYILYYSLGYILKGFIPFFPIYHENYALIDYSKIFTMMYRPTSILLEPAHASRYICIPLIISLFDKRINFKKRNLISILMSLAIVMTTSGSGIICVSVIWFIYIFKLLFNSVKNGKLKKSYLLLLLIFPIITLLVMQSSIAQNTILRIINSDLSNVNTAGGARFRGFTRYFALPMLNKIFGMGYGNINDSGLSSWFSGASYMLYGCGIIGFIICIIIFLKIYKKLNNTTGKVLLLIWFILFFIDDSFMSHVSVLYFCIISASNYKSNDLQKEREVKE